MDPRLALAGGGVLANRRLARRVAAMATRFHLMTFSHQILAGLAAGVLTGLFFGEQVIALKWAADGFVRLLQMTVLPYVVVSIVSSLGSLTYEDARRLGVRAGAVLVGLWVVALVFTFLIPLAFPSTETASFFSTSLVEQRPAFNAVDLYIPANPFNSLANNVVPAVVLFSVALGVAIIGVQRKDVLLDVLRVSGAAISRVTRAVVKLTPLGLFAIAATAAGTLSIEQITRLEVYLITYVAVALVVSLWVLPGLVATLTPIRVREIFGLTRDALLTAFIAGDLFIVLPVLTEACRTLVERHGLGDAQAAALPEAIVPVSFNFPHTGKLLSISFILFAGWFTDVAISVAEYPRLALSGLVTFFGSLNVAVPFLLDLFRIPADTFQLFLATGVINSRFGTLVAAVHTLAVGLLGTCAMVGAIRWQRRRLVRYAVVTAALTIVAIGGPRVLFATVLRPDYTRDRVLAHMGLSMPVAEHIVHRTPPADTPPPQAAVPQLELIRGRGSLRIGYLADSLPFAFFNETGELVGLDVELAHQLAHELRVRLELVPVERPQMEQRLVAGYCDLVMSGVAVTTLRASHILFSSSYMDETMGFLMRDDARDRFISWDRIREQGRITVAVPDISYYIDKLRQRLPQATLEVLPDAAAFFSGPGRFDAAMLPAERGSAWTLLHPEYSVVVPGPDFVKVPLAFPLARHDQAFASFVNTWIDLKRKDGTIDALYRRWILGQEATGRQPRWSIVRDVLQWVE